MQNLYPIQSVLCLTIEQFEKVLDPDLDNIANPHEVKHWMDPRLIPFGWGLFDIDDEVIVIERGLFIKMLEQSKILHKTFQSLKSWIFQWWD